MQGNSVPSSDIASPVDLERLPLLAAQRRVWQWGYATLWGSVGVVLGLALTGLVDAADLNSLEFTVPGFLWGTLLGFLLAGYGIWFALQRSKAYCVEHYPQSGVRVCDGVWWRNETWIPIARLQHMDVRQGPLDRWWGMATLSLYTAGTHDHVLHLRGLPLAQAQSLRAALLPQLHRGDD
ncbi:MAG: hypothetical protein CFE44_03335 [Burkholderiales bacterium PBB4]|nr:MAG: hypothetical protein CFE44_03335 [Burkholderiales bacterium PBB4]